MSRAPRLPGRTVRNAAWKQQAEEVRAFHRALRGPPGWTPWDAALLVPNLRSLAEQGYTLDDIGVMLGLSRERVRQLYTKHGIERPYAWVAGRRWHDGASRFVPVRGRTLDRIAYRHRREQRAQQVREQQSRMAQTLRQLADRIGHTPTLAEFCTEWAGKPVLNYAAGPNVRNWWFRSAKGGYRAASHALYRAAGLVLRSAGSRGHLSGSPTCSLSEVEIATALRLRWEGQSYRAIAAALGRSENAIWKRLRPYVHSAVPSQLAGRQTEDV